MTRSTLNLFSMIGLVMLMGLVTKNAILLVDFANHGRKAGLSIPEALLQAGLVRMRPIIMTTAAMIFGMLPLALALEEGGELQASMGRAIIGGVITSTLLTLIVVPVLYSYLVRERKDSVHGFPSRRAQRDRGQGGSSHACRAEGKRRRVTERRGSRHARSGRCVCQAALKTPWGRHGLNVIRSKTQPVQRYCAANVCRPSRCRRLASIVSRGAQDRRESMSRGGRSSPCGASSLETLAQLE